MADEIVIYVISSWRDKGSICMIYTKLIRKEFINELWQTAQSELMKQQDPSEIVDTLRVISPFEEWTDILLSRFEEATIKIGLNFHGSRPSSSRQHSEWWTTGNSTVGSESVKMSLKSWIAQNPKALGNKVVEKWDNNLLYLFKELCYRQCGFINYGRYKLNTLQFRDETEMKKCAKFGESNAKWRKFINSIYLESYSLWL